MITNSVSEKVIQQNKLSMKITDNLKWAMDNNLYSCGMFLDFAKALILLIIQSY